ncbi:MAG: aminoacyl-tRNA hydrolase [Deltaproteobacteria bacterium]|nr:aminoacyl-tRNA hydrolase [Deltaproteobacteria bacterium]
MKMIVGLGNPGREYERSRHNLGFWVVDMLANRLELSAWKAEHQALTLKGKRGETPFLLVKPQTFMNLSGQSVVPLLRFYKVALEDLLVVVDDIELDVGRIRARGEGGHGGHNGLRSIIGQLADQNFKRLRVGIGRPERGGVTGHVLGQVGGEEATQLEDAAQQAADIALKFLDTGQLENWSSS